MVMFCIGGGRKSSTFSSSTATVGVEALTDGIELRWADEEALAVDASPDERTLIEVGANESDVWNEKRMILLFMQ